MNAGDDRLSGARYRKLPYAPPQLAVERRAAQP